MSLDLNIIQEWYFSNKETVDTSLKFGLKAILHMEATFYCIKALAYFYLYRPLDRVDQNKLKKVGRCYLFPTPLDVILAHYVLKKR